MTPTASGKTLCYNLPVLQALLHQPDARVLYLFPTKALAQDQLAELEQLAKQLPELRMFTYDGDTPQDARRAVRARANLVLTNPDMLHSGILPHHTKWAALFQNLRYVVIDELHAYRGVFGSHVANVLRRLRRICRHYGSDAAVHHGVRDDREPARARGAHHRRRPWRRSRESGAPTGDKLFVCYNPPVVNPELGIRAPYLGEAARLALRFLRERIPTIVFAQSRLSTEVLLTAIKTGVADKTGDSGIVRGLSRRLPADAPARGRAGAARGRRARRRLDERARARRRHRPPRRRRARRLSGHHRVAVAAGGPRGTAHRAVGRDPRRDAARRSISS